VVNNEQKKRDEKEKKRKKRQVETPRKLLRLVLMIYLGIIEIMDVQ